MAFRLEVDTYSLSYFDNEKDIFSTCDLFWSVQTMALTDNNHDRLTMIMFNWQQIFQCRAVSSNFKHLPEEL